MAEYRAHRSSHCITRNNPPACNKRCVLLILSNLGIGLYPVVEPWRSQIVVLRFIVADRSAPALPARVYLIAQRDIRPMYPSTPLGRP